MPMDDERMDETIRHTLAASRRPPEPPMDEMWAQIEKRAFDDVRAPLVFRTRASRWAIPALAAAAALVLGVGLGWYAAPRNVVTRIVAAPSAGVMSPDTTSRRVASATTIPVDTEPAARAATTLPRQTMAPLRDAATAVTHDLSDSRDARLASQFDDAGSGSGMSRYLAQTAVLLASLPSDHATSASDSAVASRAGDLLTQTHLLLDSRAGSDPTLHRLLEDLELVLAQVARLRGPRNAADLQLIHQALTSHDVLPRVHDATIEASITE